MKQFMSIMAVLCILVFIAGCLTRASAYTKKTLPDGTVTESRSSVIGTGDKASEVAAEGLFADGTDSDLGAGFKNAKASQQSTGIDGSLNSLANLVNALARMKASGAVDSLSVVQPSNSEIGTTKQETASTATAITSTAISFPSENSIAVSAVLTEKIKEAKASLKPLVVIAGNTGCSICKNLDNKLDSDAGFNVRTNIVVYRETAAWANNTAAKWTGGGNGKLPVMRVTLWDAAGSIVCDKVVNRPQSVSDIESAIGSCSAP